MAFTTLLNLASDALLRIRYRFDLANYVVKEYGGKDDKVKELANDYHELTRKHNSLVYQYFDLLHKSARMEAENDFMYRYINDRENKSI